MLDINKSTRVITNRNNEPLISRYISNLTMFSLLNEEVISVKPKNQPNILTIPGIESVDDLHQKSDSFSTITTNSPCFNPVHVSKYNTQL